MTQQSLELFADPEPDREALGVGAVLLRGFALRDAPGQQPLLAAIDEVTAQAPWRHMTTPGGYRMSVAMSNCGNLGWTSDRSGYRYAPRDPESGKPWPTMPEPFRKLAHNAAAEAGFEEFAPDACLINRYEAGAKLSLHQDRDEKDYSQPIVSVSLGLPAVFQWGGLKRSDRPVRVRLRHGDVVVWGGEDRLRFHGVMPLKPGVDPAIGPYRINLTFRKAG